MRVDVARENCLIIIPPDRRQVGVLPVDTRCVYPGLKSNKEYTAADDPRGASYPAPFAKALVVRKSRRLQNVLVAPVLCQNPPFRYIRRSGVFVGP